MSEKSKLLYDLMLRKGYPEAFTRLICAEMNTDFTAERMILYISRGMHRLEDVIITCNPENIASRKTCEYLGGKLLEIAELPEDHDLREDGDTHECIYRFEL